MSAESGLRVRIDYEDVAALKTEVKELSQRMEVLTDEMQDMNKAMKSTAESSKKASKSLGLIAGIKKLELAGQMANLYGKMLDIGRASPLLASNMAMIDYQMEEIGMIIGDALAPAFETISLALESLIDWWYELDQPVKDAIQNGILVAGVIGVIAVAWGVLSLAMSPVTLAIIAIVAAVAIMTLIWEEFGDEIMVIVEEAINYVTSIFDSFAVFLDNLFKDPLGTIIQLWLDWQVLLYGTLADLFENLVPDLISAAFDIINDLFSGWGIDIGNELGFIKDIIDNMIKAWSGIFQSFADFFGTVFDDPIGAIITLFSDLVDVVIGYIGGLVDAIGGYFVDLAIDALDWGVNIITGIVDGAISAVGSLFSSVIDAILDFWPFSPAKTGPLSGTTLFDAGWNFLSSLIDGMIGAITGLAPAMFDALLSFIPDAVGVGLDIGSGIVDGIGDALKGVGDVIGDTIGAVTSIFGGGGTNFADLSLEQQAEMIPAFKELIAKLESEGKGTNLIATMLKKQVEAFEGMNITVVIDEDVTKRYGLQHGGIVPGPPGTAVPILAHAPELLLNRAQQSNLGGYIDRLERNTFNNQRSTVININIAGTEGDGRQVGGSIAEQLRRTIRGKGLT